MNKLILISCILVGCLIGSIQSQYYEDCEIWLYRSKPDSNNLFDRNIVNQILTGSQQNSGTFYESLTPFRYYAFRNCPFQDSQCQVYTSVVPQIIHIPTLMYPINEELASAAGCKNNFTLSCL